MHLITTALLCFFLLQYYLTLALTITFNLLRKAFTWVAGGKDGPKIHPFHNAHEEVFAWKGKMVTMQRIS